MIRVEGYKAFHGKMIITPKTKMLPEYEVGPCDWLYKPEYDCWYGNGCSYVAEICTPVEE